MENANIDWFLTIIGLRSQLFNELRPVSLYLFNKNYFCGNALKTLKSGMKNIMKIGIICIILNKLDSSAYAFIIFYKLFRLFFSHSFGLNVVG